MYQAPKCSKISIARECIVSPTTGGLPPRVPAFSRDSGRRFASHHTIRGGSTAYLAELEERGVARPDLVTVSVWVAGSAGGVGPTLPRCREPTAGDGDREGEDGGSSSPHVELATAVTAEPWHAPWT